MTGMGSPSDRPQFRPAARGRSVRRSVLAGVSAVMMLLSAPAVQASAATQNAGATQSTATTLSGIDPVEE